MSARVQRYEALRRANKVRSLRAGLKRDLAAGRANPVALLDDPPQWAEGMTVGDVLGSPRGWGASRVGKLLARTGQPPVHANHRLGDLSCERRRLIAGLWADAEAGLASRRMNRCAAPGCERATAGTRCKPCDTKNRRALAARIRELRGAGVTRDGIIAELGIGVRSVQRALAPPKRKPPAPARPVPVTHCARCRVRLRVPTGLCGFCAEELAA